MFVFKNLDIYFLLVLLAKVRLAYNLIPAPLDPLTRNFVGHRFNNQQLCVEVLLQRFPLLLELFDGLGNLVKQALHKEPCESLVAIEGVLRDHKNVVVQHTEHRSTKLLELIIGNRRIVLKLYVRVDQLLDQLPLLLHFGLELPFHISKLKETHIERRKIYSFKHNIHDSPISKDLGKFPQQCAVYLKAHANVTVEHVLIKNGARFGERRI